MTNIDRSSRLVDDLTALTSAMYASARAAARALREQGITPTLGLIYVDNGRPDPEGLRLLREGTASVGVALRGGGIEIHRSPAVAAPDSAPAGEWKPRRHSESTPSWSDMLAKLGESHPPHGPGRVPAGVGPDTGTDVFAVLATPATSTDTSGGGLGAWLHRMRVDYIAYQAQPLLADPAVHAVLVLPPLPRGVVHRDLARAIPADRDIDGIHPATLADLVPGVDLERHNIVPGATLFCPSTPEPFRRLATGLLLYATAVRAARANDVALPAPTTGDQHRVRPTP